MAGVQVGVGYVDIRPDLSHFGRQLRTEVTRDVSRAGDDASRSLKQSFAGAAKGAAASFGAAFAAVKLKDFIGGAIQAASDLAESVSKVGVVFGDSAGRVEAFAETAAESIGQSKQQALEATGTFGNLFVSMGLGGNAATDMSIKLVQLASDLASFNNVDPAQALDALRSGLVGETEPLRRFGVNLNEATLKQKALELGLRATGATLDPAIKAQAAYALILEQTTTAQGDFARTADGLANQQRTLNAQWTDAKAELGEGLVPVLLEFAKIINDDVLPAFKTLFLSSDADATGWAASLRDAIGDTVGFILGAFAELARGVANVIGAIPVVGEGVVSNLREVADAIDGARTRLHASTGELLQWSAATDTAKEATARLALVTRGYLPDLKEQAAGTKDLAAANREGAKASRDAGAAERDLRRAKADLSKLEKQGAVDAEKVAEARERLAEATRSAGHANRELAKAQREYDQAAAAAAILGTDTAAEELADAKDNLADATDTATSAHERELKAAKDLKEAQAGDPDFQDKLADAKDKVADAQDRVATTADKIAASAKAAGDAQAALNKELSFTKDQVKEIVGFLDEEIKPKTMGEWLAGGGLLGQSLGAPIQNSQPAFTLPAFGVPGQTPLTPPTLPAASSPILGPPLPSTVTTTNNVTVNVPAPVSNPDYLGKAIMWALN